MGRIISSRERFEGAFLGFAIGDAFGYPARGMTFEQLCERFEKKGCLDLAVSKKSGMALFTDATQMTLFTADGIVWADREAKGGEINYTTYVFYSYQLWLYTQTKTIAGKEYSWLFNDEKNKYTSHLLKAKGLYKNRANDRVSVDALLAARELNYGKLISHVNDNADNGGLKRVLPAGLYFNYDTEIAFRAGADFAAITHGNPSAYLSAGCYSAITAELIAGQSVENAVKKVMRILKEYDGHEQVYLALDSALTLIYDESVPPREAIERLGRGYNAEEALAISIFCAVLHEDNFIHAIQLAVNHDGESDVCAALTGGLLGARNGVECIPKKWIKKIQYYNLLLDTEELLYNVTVFNDRNYDDNGENGDYGGNGDEDEDEDNSEEKSKRKKRFTDTDFNF